MRALPKDFDRGHNRFEASFRQNCRYLHGRTRLFYRLDVKSFSLIKETFGSAIFCPAGESFWDDLKQSAVATLILVGKVAEVRNVQFKKRDRRGWVVFKGCLN
jgi:hypothetical protein